MAKYLVQVVVLSAQVIGRAFTRALQQEYAASSAAAKQGGTAAERTGSRAQAMSNIKHGLTSQEARCILNVPGENLVPEKVDAAYNHLFQANEKAKGGSFYLQSKVVRAKERLYEELRMQIEKNKKS